MQVNGPIAKTTVSMGESMGSHFYAMLELNADSLGIAASKNPEVDFYLSVNFQ